MEIAAAVPAWLTWIAAGAAGVAGLAILAFGLEAVFELERG